MPKLTEKNGNFALSLQKALRILEIEKQGLLKLYHSVYFGDLHSVIFC